jgi:hypothetical protein
VGLLVDPHLTIVFKRDPVADRVRIIAKIPTATWGLSAATELKQRFAVSVQLALQRLRDAVAHGRYEGVPPEFVPDVTEALLRGDLLSQATIALS